MRCDRQRHRHQEVIFGGRQLPGAYLPPGNLVSRDSENRTEALRSPPSASLFHSCAQISVLSAFSPSVAVLRNEPPKMICEQILICLLETVVVPHFGLLYPNPKHVTDFLPREAQHTEMERVLDFVGEKD